MSKWNTGRINQLPTEGAFWANGVLTIDGMDSRTIIERCIARGLCKHGVMVYRHDSKPISKPRMKKVCEN